LWLWIELVQCCGCLDFCNFIYNLLKVEGQSSPPNCRLSSFTFPADLIGF
jgi:hypothetical protein